MDRDSGCFHDPAWDEETIHEFLGPEPARPCPVKPERPDLDSASTAPSDSLPASPQTKRRRGHKRVPLKEKVLRSVPEVPDQTQTIKDIDQTLQSLDASQVKDPIYGSYSRQQKKAILAQLQSRIHTIESSIVAAKTALEKIIKFM